jgi:hypothetical protein
MNTVMKTPLSFLLLLLAPVLAHGQDSTRVGVVAKKTFQIDFQPGYLQGDLSSINNSLREYGYNPMEGNMLTYTVSAKFIIRRFVMDLGVPFFRASDQSHSNQSRTTLMGTGFNFEVNLGYALVEKKSFRLSPYAGLVSSYASLKLMDTSPVTSLGNIMNGTRREGTLTFSGGSFNLGVHAEKLIPLNNRKIDCPQNNRYLSLGVKAGYLFPINGGEPGEYNGQELLNAPRFALKGPYLRLVIGVGTRIRQLKWQ